MTEGHELIAAVEDDIEQLMADHIAKRPTWYAHDLIKWEEGRNYVEEPWDESQCTISPEVREALVLNLLTEDNLPYYHFAIASGFPADSAIGRWTRRWTAEEGQHAIVIRDYLMISRNCDPISLENDRMATISKGWDSPWDNPLDIFVYTSAQELATPVLREWKIDALEGLTPEADAGCWRWRTSLRSFDLGSGARRKHGLRRSRAAQPGAAPRRRKVRRRQRHRGCRCVRGC